MTGSVRHMMGRPVEVKAVSKHHSHEVLQLPVICEQVSISGVLLKKRLCRHVQETHPACEGL